MVVEVSLILGTAIVLTDVGLLFVSLGLLGLSVFSLTSNKAGGNLYLLFLTLLCWFFYLRLSCLACRKRVVEMFANGVNLIFAYSSKSAVVVT